MDQLSKEARKDEVGKLTDQIVDLVNQRLLPRHQAGKLAASDLIYIVSVALVNALVIVTISKLEQLNGVQGLIDHLKHLLQDKADIAMRLRQRELDTGVPMEDLDRERSRSLSSSLWD